MNRRRTTVAQAFSLIEVTFALGVAAFCLAAVFGLLSTGVGIHRQSTEREGLTYTMTAIAADLRATPRGTNISPQFKITVPASNASSGTTTLYFDSAGQYSSAITATSRYQVNISFVPNSAGPHAATFVNIGITAPAAASPTSASSSINGFVALDRN